MDKTRFLWTKTWAHVDKNWVEKLKFRESPYKLLTYHSGSYTILERAEVRRLLQESSRFQVENIAQWTYVDILNGQKVVYVDIKCGKIKMSTYHDDTCGQNMWTALLDIEWTESVDKQPGHMWTHKWTFKWTSMWTRNVDKKIASTHIECRHQWTKHVDSSTGH